MARLAFTFILLVVKSVFCSKDVVDGGRDLLRLTLQSHELPDTLMEEWTTTLLQLCAGLETAVDDELKNSSAQNRQLFGETSSALQQVISREKTDLLSYAGKQGQQLKTLLQRCVNIVKAKLSTASSAAADETAIVELRHAKRALLEEWEFKLFIITIKIRAAFRSVYKFALRNVHAPNVEQSLRESAARVLGKLVDYQARVMKTLTATQFTAVNNFVTEVGRVLLERAASVQAKHL